VKSVIGVVEPFGFAIEGAKRYADVGVRVSDAFLDLFLYGDKAGELRERGSRHECDDKEKEDELPQR
jgi:hypothetical protein